MHLTVFFDELLVRPDYATARADIIDGICAFRVWTRLGWQEVKRRYRRTFFGPFWATLSIGAFIGGMVFIWAPLFKTDVTSYLPFLSAGLVTWTFATALISEGCGTYTGGITLITQLKFPYTILNFMVVWRNVIVFFHNVLIVVIVVIALRIPVTWQTLLLFPGIIIVAVNGAWMTILFGMVSARFRDVPPLVGNIIQILMFVTPIFWFSSQLGPGAQPIVTYNFMFHLIEVMRAPMLGTAPSLLSYGVTIAGAVIGWIVTFDLYARFRRRIPYWL